MKSEELTRILDDYAHRVEASPAALQETLDRSRQLRQRRGWLRAAAVVAGVAVVGLTATMANRLSSSELSTPASAPDRVGSFAIEVLPPAPLGARSNHAQTTLGERLFVWGGEAPSGPDDAGAMSAGEPLDDGAIFNPATGGWHELPASPLSARSHAVAAWTGEQVLVMGGRADGTPLTDTAAYDPSTDGWTRLSAAPICPQLAAVIADVVIAAGACGPEQPQLAAYAPRSDRWTVIESRAVGDPTSIAVAGSSVLVGDVNGRVVVVDAQSLDVREVSGPSHELEFTLVGDGTQAYALSTPLDSGAAEPILSRFDGATWHAVVDQTREVGSTTGPRPTFVGSTLVYATDRGACVWSAQETSDCTSDDLNASLVRSNTQFVATESGTRAYLWGGLTFESGGGYALASRTGAVLQID